MGHGGGKISDGVIIFGCKQEQSFIPSFLNFLSESFHLLSMCLCLLAVLCTLVLHAFKFCSRNRIDISKSAHCRT